MPVHDWTRVEAGIFHSFHVGWIPEIGKALNTGVLPEGYYALTEQHAGRAIADILTLHSNQVAEAISSQPPTPTSGGTALAEAPPRVRKRRSIDFDFVIRRRSLAIRHVSEHRLIALIEILSPGNKDRPQSVDDFVRKALGALKAGIHLLIIDLLPPGRHDADGINGVISRELEWSEESHGPPQDEPLTLASYTAGPPIEIFTEHVAVGALLPEMPLFISPDRYVNVPLESTYKDAYRGMPTFWREVVEGKRSVGSALP